MSFREKFIEECLNLFRREDVKREMKNLFRPLVLMILQDIYPYIYISLIFVIISFLLILGIFILMLRKGRCTM
jgi:cellulose synthase/poly-beta-1,6-N-acetylglucosamine synthase-like glycosyltransferase